MKGDPYPDDGYDPHEHRNVEHPTTNMQTLTNFIKAAVGTGVLAMPNAFANSGWVLGIVLTIVICIIAVYGLHILIDGMYELSKRQHVPYLSFADAMVIGFSQGPPCLKCFAPIARPFVDFFLAFYHFGICCVYVVFIAVSIKQLIDVHFAVIDVRLHMCFIIPPLLLIYSIRNLKYIAPFSSVANFLLVFGFGVIFYYIFICLPPITEREKFVSIERLPIFFGTVLFSLEAVGVILAIEANMLHPKAYVTPCGIMNVGMGIVVSLYIFLGFFGYWRYGEETKGSITLNIPQEDVLAQVIKILFAVSVWISYALQGYVTTDIVWNKHLSKHVANPNRHFCYEEILRAFTVLLSVAFAILIPDLGLFLSLVGSFCLSILGLVFPGLLQICVKYHSGYGPLKIRLFLNIFIICFGIFGGCVGTYMSVKEIVAEYMEHKLET